METLRKVFACCVPGPRSRQGREVQGQDESTPLLADGSTASSARGGQQSHPRLSSASTTPSASAGPSGDANSSTAAAAAAAQPMQEATPNYTVNDLAVITGWAREHFLDVNDTGVLESRDRRSFTNRLGKVSEGAEEDSDGKRKSLVEPINVSEDHQDAEKNAKIQALVENLAKGIAFNGWAQEQPLANPNPSASASTSTGVEEEDPERL